jgi:hypothetical protein
MLKNYPTDNARGGLAVLLFGVFVGAAAVTLYVAAFGGLHWAFVCG